MFRLRWLGKWGKNIVDIKSEEPHKIVFAIMMGVCSLQRLPGLRPLMTNPSDHVVEQAFASMPGGSYLLTAAHDGTRSGMLVQWVSRCCDDPMLICVSAKKGHAIDPLIRDSHSFALGVIDPDDKLIKRRFGKASTWPNEDQSDEDDDPFDAMPTAKLVTGAPTLPRCPIWFDCEVLRRIDLESDTELFVGLVLGVSCDGQAVKIPRSIKTDAND